MLVGRANGFALDPPGGVGRFDRHLPDLTLRACDQGDDRFVARLAGLIIARQHQIAGRHRLDGLHAVWRLNLRTLDEAVAGSRDGGRRSRADR